MVFQAPTQPKPLDPNRAERRRGTDASGPFQHFRVKMRKSKRRTSTRGKRTEQRNRAKGIE